MVSLRKVESLLGCRAIGVLHGSKTHPKQNVFARLRMLAQKCSRLELENSVQATDIGIHVRARSIHVVQVHHLLLPGGRRRIEGFGKLTVRRKPKEQLCATNQLCRLDGRLGDAHACSHTGNPFHSLRMYIQRVRNSDRSKTSQGRLALE